MLSNRRWWLKVLIPVAGFVALCAHAGWVMRDTRIDVARCLREPDTYDGREIWMPPREVAGNFPDGSFNTIGNGITVRVRADHTPGNGKFVSVRGVFRKPDLVVAAPKGLQVNPAYRLQRGGVYGISGVVLVAWLWWFLKRFRPGLAGFAPRLDAPPDAPPPGVEKT